MCQAHGGVEPRMQTGRKSLNKIKNLFKIKQTAGVAAKLTTQEKQKTGSDCENYI